MFMLLYVLLYLMLSFFQSEKATEMHRLRCCDGSNENNEIQKSYSILTSITPGNDRNVDAFLSQVHK